MKLDISIDQAMLIAAAMDQGIASGKGTQYEVLLAQSIINLIERAELDGDL